MNAITETVAPVDLEEQTELVVGYAAYMTEKLSAKLTMIHVVELLRAMGDIALGATDLMKNLISVHPTCTGEVMTGDTVDEIVSFVEKNKKIICKVLTGNYQFFQQWSTEPPTAIGGTKQLPGFMIFFTEPLLKGEIWPGAREGKTEVKTGILFSVRFSAYACFWILPLSFL